MTTCLTSTAVPPSLLTPRSTAAPMVAVYETAEAATEAIERLVRFGFDLRRISVAGKESHADGQVVGSYRTGEQMTYWGRVGAFWGGAWELLCGSAFFLVPTLGPVLVAGPLVGSILAALGGGAAARGMTALRAGFCHHGIPKDRAEDCEAAIRAGRYVLIAHGTALGTTLAEMHVELSNRRSFSPEPAAEDSRWLDDGGSAPADVGPSPEGDSVHGICEFGAERIGTSPAAFWQGRTEPGLPRP